MKKSRFLSVSLLLAPALALLNGCGGGGGSSGGGGGSTPTATPTVSPTATLGARVLVVQLRDAKGGRVDGIVTVGTAIVATVNGDATFNRNLAAGAVSVSAEVDGDTTTGTATVKSGGTTAFTLTIAPRVTPAPTAPLPPPPF